MSTDAEHLIDAAELRGHIRAMYRDVAGSPMATSTSSSAGSWPSGSATRPTGSTRSRPTRWRPSPASGTCSTWRDRPGETMLDLGSGSGTDTFVAAT